MLKNLKENLAVLFFIYRYLSNQGYFIVFIMVASSLVAILVLFLTKYSGVTLIIFLIGFSTVLIQLIFNYRSNLKTPFSICKTSPGAIKLYKNIISDLTPEFDIVSLSSGTKISHSILLNQKLINNESINISINREYEKNILKKWSNEKEKLSEFLVFKANATGCLFNEKKIALISNLYSSMKQVEIGETSYFTSLVTNDVSGKSLSNDADNNIINFDNLIPVLDCKLLDIPSSRLSNHIGVTLLGLTKDNHLIFWSQNADAQQNINSLVASGSGSLDWNDLNLSKSNELLNIVKYGMVRELIEECNLEKNILDKLYPHNTSVIGYFRWIERGGKPEFVGVCKLPVSAASFHPNLQEVSNECGGKYIKHPPIYSMSELYDLCERYSSDKNIKISTPLEYLLYQIMIIAEDSNSTMYLKLKEFLKLES